MKILDLAGQVIKYFVVRSYSEILVIIIANNDKASMEQVRLLRDSQENVRKVSRRHRLLAGALLLCYSVARPECN